MHAVHIRPLLPLIRCAQVASQQVLTPEAHTAEPLWATFCGTSGGLWNGQLAAFSPATGASAQPLGGWSHCCCAALLQGLFRACSRRTACQQQLSESCTMQCPCLPRQQMRVRPGLSAAEAAARAALAGLPEAVSLDARGGEVLQLQSHCVEERTTSDAAGDCLQRRALLFTSPQQAAQLAAASPDDAPGGDPVQRLALGSMRSQAHLPRDVCSALSCTQRRALQFTVPQQAGQLAAASSDNAPGGEACGKAMRCPQFVAAPGLPVCWVPACCCWHRPRQAEAHHPKTGSVQPARRRHAITPTCPGLQRRMAKHAGKPMCLAAAGHLSCCWPAAGSAIAAHPPCTPQSAACRACAVRPCRCQGRGRRCWAQRRRAWGLGDC